jgi:hypothetical protein
MPQQTVGRFHGTAFPARRNIGGLNAGQTIETDGIERLKSPRMLGTMAEKARVPPPVHQPGADLPA